MRVMQPETETDLAAMIRAADAPMSVVGGATRLWPGEAQGARITTGGLSGIALYEPAALTLVVRAGTPLAEVEQALRAEGQMLAFEPDLRAGSTIGGVVAANASGPRRVLSGACRDALIGVRFVTGDGEIVSNGGRVMKNVTGYDLVKLMAGSRGRLGALTEVSLKTAPLPPAKAVLRLPGIGAADAVTALTAALSRPFDVSAAGWVPGAGALIRIEGLEGSVAIRRAGLIDLLSRFCDVAEGGDIAALTPRPPREADLWRIICRPSEAQVLLAVLPEPLAVDWGGALIWLALPAGEAPRLPAFSGHAQRVMGAAPARLPPQAAGITALEAGIARAWDRRGIFRGA